MIKYLLNADGTIPSFLYTGNNGLAGALPNNNPNGVSPQDMWLIGISNDSDLPSNQAEIIASKEDLKDYLDTFTSNWTKPDPSQMNNADAVIPFDQQEYADMAWSKLEALNFTQTK